MWFSEKALVFIDARSAALAVYRHGFSRPRLTRFGSERFASRANGADPFSEALADSKEAIARLCRDLKAPAQDATLLLPLGASFPSIVDVSGLRKPSSEEVEEADLIRFRLAPLLPFPIALAEVRSERSSTLRSGSVLAQAVLRNRIEEGERMMASLGFPRPHVTSSLSAALRGLKPKPGAVDLLFGDSACAIAVRDATGVMEAIHLRLLVEGDDRIQRSVDEALRATSDVAEIRVIGEAASSLGTGGRVLIQPAFDSLAFQGAADPQRFPFLAVFHEGAAR
jgi:hypothetical protein